MSIHNGVNELYLHEIQFVFSTVKGEVEKEIWNFIKDENMEPTKYGFIQEGKLSIDYVCECMDLSQLKNKFENIIKQKINSDLSLVEVINAAGAKILTLENQKEVLGKLGLFALKESLVFSEQKLS